MVVQYKWATKVLRKLTDSLDLNFSQQYCRVPTNYSTSPLAQKPFIPTNNSYKMQFNTFLIIITSISSAASAMPASNAEQLEVRMNLGTPTERDVPSQVQERAEKVTEWKAKGGDCEISWGGHCQAQCVSESLSKKCHSGTVVSEIVGCGIFKPGQSKCVCDCTITK